MAEWSACRTCNPAVESRSDHYLDLFHGSPEFNCSATLVISLTDLPPASWDS